MNTYLLYCRFQLMRGALSASEYADEIDLVRHTLGTSRRRNRTGRNILPPGRSKPPRGKARSVPIAGWNNDWNGCRSTAWILKFAGSGAENGKVVFVANALPGERVQARIHRSKRNWESGEAVAWASTASSRVTPRCPHFGVCGGCSMQHVDPAAQLAFKQHSRR